MYQPSPIMRYYALYNIEREIPWNYSNMLPIYLLYNKLFGFIVR